jgi:hypothetical protein
MGAQDKLQTLLSTYYHALETSVKALYQWRGCSHKLRNCWSWTRCHNFNDFVRRKNFSQNKLDSKHCFPSLITVRYIR